MGPSDVIAPAPVAGEKVTKSSSSSASGGFGNDTEKQTVPQLPDLKRKLKSRHLQMIAIGRSMHGE